MRSEESGGAFALFEFDIPPKILIAPLHTHGREDEYSYVVSGTVGAKIGDRTLVAGPGRLLAKPRGIPHTLWNPGAEPARVLELIVPGGFERCLERLPLAAAGDRAGAPADLERLWAEYGIEMHADSAPALLREHGLAGVGVA